MIEFNEFNEWVRESEEIQDFLLKYTGQQTFERARKRYRQLREFYKEVFDKNAIDFMGEKVRELIFKRLQYVTMIDLRKELKQALKEIKPHIREKLFVILDYEDKGAVSETEYLGVMKLWASFSATDINNDNQLDAGELKTLIWLVEEKEPSETRV